MKPKKIILIVIDTLRADHLGSYGYKRNTSPNIDTLAEEGIIFKNAFSPSSFTIPSHASVFTSKYPSNHTIGFNQTESGSLNKDLDITLAEIFNFCGYKTAGFVSSVVLRKETNLCSGFDQYDDHTPDSKISGPRMLIRYGEKTNESVFNWLENHYNTDFFMFINYFDVHDPYVHQEPYQKLFLNDSLYNLNFSPLEVMPQGTLGGLWSGQLLNAKFDENGKLVDYEKNPNYYIAQYDAGIRYVDDCIGNLVSFLKKLEIYDDCLILITSDHGESMLENGINFFHGWTVTLDQISVPLIIKPNKDWNITCDQINIPVSTIDIMPTLLSLIDYDYSSLEFNGHSLVSLIENKNNLQSKQRKIISENEYQIALISNDTTLIEYHKKNPPSSQYNFYAEKIIDSLDGKKIYFDTCMEYELALPFDEYQRYKVVADIINKFRTESNDFKILDVGAGNRETLSKFLPNDEIDYYDKELQPEHEQRNNYFRGNFIESNLENKYDFVVSIDTYEHIPQVSRDIFLNKLLDLSKVATIIANPFDEPGVREYEIFANESYKISHGIDYKWLKEHIQNGLPSLNITLESIKKSGNVYTVIPNGYLPRWFEMISMYLLTEGMPKFSKIMVNLYEFYNKNFYCYDNLNPAYRQVIVVSKRGKNPDFSDIYAKNHNIDVEFNNKLDTLQSFARKIRDLYNEYNYIEIMELKKQITTLNNTLQSRDSQIAELTSTLQYRNDQVAELTSTLQYRNGQVAELTSSLQLRNGQVGELINTLRSRDTLIKSKDSQIYELNIALQSMQQSIVWRTSMKFHGFIEWLLPNESYRRECYESTLLWVRELLNLNKNLEQENDIIARYTDNKIKNFDIFCFPIINWNFRYQRPQQLLSRFAKNGYRVFYLTSELNYLGRPYHVKEIEKDVLEIKLSISSKFNVHNNILTKKQTDSILNSIKKLKKDFNIDEAICFVDFPNWEPATSKLKEMYGWNIIYDCMDEHTGFSNVKDTVVDEETKLFKESDLVVVTSNHLLKKANKFIKEVVLIPNAGDFEHFNNLPENNLLANIKKPIIGYYGAIAEWFDDELIDFLSRNRSDWNFVFIGHTFGSDLKKFNKSNNVHFLGEKPYAELPGYLYWFDVCIIPFKLTPLIQATHPVKFYEYLSSGKPVVSSKLPELLPYQDLCYIAETKEEFLEKIEIALKERDMDIRNKRIEFAKNNTWDARYQVLITQIENVSKKDE